MKQDPDRYHSQIENAANRFLASFGPKLTQNPNGHIVTDIAGAASVTGLMLLRSVCPDLDRFPPGSVVLGDFMDRLYPEQQQMQLFFKNLARQMGLNEIDGWNVEPPEALSPLMETSELMRKLEPAFDGDIFLREANALDYDVVPLCKPGELLPVGIRFRIFSLHGSLIN